MELKTKQRDTKDGHSVRALIVTILCQILYAPFYIVGLLKVCGLCNVTGLNASALSLDIGPCPELDVARTMSGIFMVLAGLAMTSFVGYKAGSLKTNQKRQFLTLAGVGLFFVLTIFLLPLLMLFGA